MIEILTGGVGTLKGVVNVITATVFLGGFLGFLLFISSPNLKQLFKGKNLLMLTLYIFLMIIGIIILS